MVELRDFAEEYQAVSDYDKATRDETLYEALCDFVEAWQWGVYGDSIHVCITFFGERYRNSFMNWMRSVGLLALVELHDGSSRIIDFTVNRSDMGLFL